MQTRAGTSPDFFGSDADVAALEAQLAHAGASPRAVHLATLAWYLRQRDTRRALTLADEAQAVSDAGGEPSHRPLAPATPRLALVRAEAKLLFGEPAAALALATAAHREFEAMADWAGTADALVVLESAETHPGAASRAGQLMQEAVEAARRSGDEVRLATFQARQACSDLLADHRAGVSSWSAFIDGLLAHSHPGVQAAAEAFRARCDFLDEKPTAAAVRWARVFELELASGQRRRAVAAAVNLVALHTDLSDDASALQWCERALEIARPAAWPLATADVLMRMARCHHHLGELETARELFAEAAATLSLHRGLDDWATVCRYAGENLLAMGRHQEAVHWLRRGVVASRRLGRLEAAACCRHAQATALSRLGRRGLAVAALAQAFEFNERSGARRGTRAHILHAYAGVARDHALPAPPGSAAPTGAVHYLEAALAEIAGDEGDAPDEWLSELSRDYEELGDPTRALACERRAVEARTRTQSRRAADLALSLQVRHETEQAKAEAAHHKALAEAEAQRAEAEAQANRAKSTFLANMNHELRSPLNAMLGFTRLLLRDPTLDAHHDDLAVVMRSGEHLYALINQVLEMPKIEAGRLALEPSDFDLHAMLTELGEMFSVSVHHKGIELAVEWAGDVPRYVHADEIKLRQVLINLLSNAVKFTPRGGVRLDARARAGAGGTVLDFEVVDTGVGISPQELDRLGQAFVQAHAGRQAAEGTGLGLAISRGLVRLMGGELELASTPGVGTRVRFSVPLQAVARPAAPAGRRRVLHLAPGSGAPRILVVDDRADSRLLVRRTLAPLGFEVREAEDGAQGVAAWRDWSPQLVLMDMRMPVMDGGEATRRIKAEDTTGTVIVALTASSFEEEREDILATGCADFLRKPFREDVLLETIARHLGLEYVYETAEAAAPVEPEAQRLARLPAALRERLRRALEQLDVVAVDDALAEVRTHDPLCADMLVPLARRFEYERMRALLPAR